MSADRHIPTLEDIALSQAVHARGMQMASYVSGVERENILLRQLLLQCSPFVPVRVKSKIAAFCHRDDN